MKKIKNNNESILKVSVTTLSILVVISLILTSFSGSIVGANTTKTTDNDNLQVITKNILFSDPKLETSNFVDYEMNTEFLKINIDGANSYINKPGEPLLPSYKTVFEIPLGSIVKDVSVTMSSEEIIKIPAKIEPAPVPIPLNYEQNLPMIQTGLMNIFDKISSRFSEKQDIKSMSSEIKEINKDIYGSNNFYPESDNHNYRCVVGRNDNDVITTFVLVNVNLVRYSPNTDTLKFVSEVNIKCSYIESEIAFESMDTQDVDVDLLILTPNKYKRDLNTLVTHKEQMGLKTKLVNLDEIYDGTHCDVSNGRDNQEKIKLFIKASIENWNVKYVLLVGGYRTFFGLNNPNKQFPVRYAHLDDDAEDGYLSDLYYSDIYRYDESIGYAFDTWDSNGNDRFAEWDWNGKDEVDLVPDVYLGRLACRNNKEVKTMIKKIKTYETKADGEEWFERMLVITGDGFQDQVDLGPNLIWDINGIPDGDYTIYAQSELSDDSSVKGPIDKVQITIDRAQESNITFVEDDHEKIESIKGDQTSLYPAKPVAEITSPSDGNNLGNTDVFFVDPKAYIGYRWAPVHYNAVEGFMVIRGKSYDPTPQIDGDYGSHTKMRVWINDSFGVKIEEFALVESDMWYEGETETLIAMNNMPSEFEKDILWTSNGNFTHESDVIDAISKGCGFLYFAGHGNPMIWADHFPGIPGGRGPGGVDGMHTIKMDGRPYLPMSKLVNGDKLPILVVGGCHNSMFDTSLMKLFYDPSTAIYGMKSGQYAFECWSWWIVRVPQGGAISSIGCSGLGYGYLGEACTEGLGGWINPEFFRQYNEEGVDVLGETFAETLKSYMFDCEMSDPWSGKTDCKTVQEWILLGDPSLKIGGYGSKTSSEEVTVFDEFEEVFYSQPVSPESIGKVEFPMSATISDNIDFPISTSSDEWQITDNSMSDTNPSFVSKDGKYLVGYIEEVPLFDSTTTDAALAFSNGGTVWTRLLPSWSDRQDYIDIDMKGFGDGAYATFGNQGSNLYMMILNDITNPSSWGSIHWGKWILHDVGKNGISIASGHPHETVWGDGHWMIGVIADNEYQEYKTQCPNWFFPIYNEFGMGSCGWYTGCDNSKHMTGDIDPTTLFGHWAFEKKSTGGMIVSFYADHDGFGGAGHIELDISQDFTNPDVVADDGYAYVSFEKSGSIKCYVSSNNGQTWMLNTISDIGTNPKLVLQPTGDIICYFVKDGGIQSKTSNDHGATWNSDGEIISEVSNGDYVMDATVDGIVYETTDSELFAHLFGLFPINDAQIYDIITSSKRKVTATIMNSGTNELADDATWEMIVEGVDITGAFPILKGRVLLGRIQSGGIDLEPTEETTVTSKIIYGFGFVEITINVKVGDDIIASQTEDGFLIGGNILLHHGIE